MIPAASLHLSDALLRATGNNEPVRRVAVKALYGLGVVFVGLALFTDLIARSGLSSENLPHLRPGSLFIFFTLYYFPTLVWATYNVIVARRRALTATSKRRLTYFAWAFAAPAVGMFPYFLPTGWPAVLSAAHCVAGHLVCQHGRRHGHYVYDLHRVVLRGQRPRPRD